MKAKTPETVYKDYAVYLLHKAAALEVNANSRIVRELREYKLSGVVLGSFGKDQLREKEQFFRDAHKTIVDYAKIKKSTIVIKPFV